MLKLFDIPLWGRGFRPFFLSGALYAALIVLAWVSIFNGSMDAPPFWNDAVLWHAHEMIYGFTMAIVAGFLLTAVANWTGGAPVRQIHLAFLTLVWWLGRLGFWYPYAPHSVLAFIDLLFIPLLATSLAIPLVRSWNKRNFVFLGMLAFLFLGNLHMHLGMTGLVGGDPRTTAYIAVLIIIMMISLIGGRIIPSFTVAALRMQGKIRYQTAQDKADIAALLSLLALSFSIGFGGLETMLTGVISLVSAAIHLWRMRFWHTLETASEPLLWVLHVGYFWLVLGLFTLGLHGLAYVDQPSLSLHMLTVGSIGSMTLGMMARVALGHTGRPLRLEPLTVAAFWMMQASAVIRCLAVLVGLAHYQAWIIASGSMWAAAFGIYLFVYLPVLTGPRPDGLEA